MPARHIFLTGDAGVGKSTILSNYLAKSGLSASGFSTYWSPATQPSDPSLSVQPNANLYLCAYGNQQGNPEAAQYLLARRRNGHVKPVDDMTAVFDQHGTAILDNLGVGDVIVMDEIGRLESSATKFQAAILRRLAGDIPVLGVLRSARGLYRPSITEFISVIHSYPTVTVVEVTLQNRASVLVKLLSSAY